MTSSPAPRRLPFFVYGTLRESGENAHAWPDGAIESRRRAHLAGATMSAVEFPYVWRTASGEVVGDLVTARPEHYDATLTSLDALEGYHGPGLDNHYERDVVQVRLEDGGVEEAWVYLVDESVGSPHPTVPSGDWDDRRPVEAAGRTDTASRMVAASTGEVFAALVDPTALEAWLPPSGMSGRVERFEPRPGGAFRMVLTYDDPGTAEGKSSADSDVVDGRIVQVVPGHRLIWTTRFDSDDPAFAGLMRMTWDLVSEADGTRVELRADGVPEGISPEDHAVGMAASLAQLADFVTQRAGQ